MSKTMKLAANHKADPFNAEVDDILGDWDQ